MERNRDQLIFNLTQIKPNVITKKIHDVLHQYYSLKSVVWTFILKTTYITYYFNYISGNFKIITKIINIPWNPFLQSSSIVLSWLKPVYLLLLVYMARGNAKSIPVIHYFNGPCKITQTPRMYLQKYLWQHWQWSEKKNPHNQVKSHLQEMKELGCILNRTYYIDINESIYWIYCRYSNNYL